MVQSKTKYGICDMVAIASAPGSWRGNLNLIHVRHDVRAAQRVGFKSCSPAQNSMDVVSVASF